jgi:hypothetical protein
VVLESLSELPLSVLPRPILLRLLAPSLSDNFRDESVLLRLREGLSITGLASSPPPPPLLAMELVSEFLFFRPLRLNDFEKLERLHCVVPRRSVSLAVAIVFRPGSPGVEVGSLLSGGKTVWVRM